MTWSTRRRHKILQALEGSLRQDPAEGWLAERQSEKGLKHSRLRAGYEDVLERLYRDHGADTPVPRLCRWVLAWLLADFKSYRVLGKLGPPGASRRQGRAQ